MPTHNRIESVWIEALEYLQYVPEDKAEEAEARLAEVYAAVLIARDSLAYFTREIRWEVGEDA